MSGCEGERASSLVGIRETRFSCVQLNGTANCFGGFSVVMVTTFDLHCPQ